MLTRSDPSAIAPNPARLRVIVPVKLPDDWTALAVQIPFWRDLVGSDAAIACTVVTNGQVSRAIADELEALRSPSRAFDWLHVQTSCTKAENINAAVAASSEQYVALFDVDARPTLGALQLGMELLSDPKCSVVQGPKSVRMVSQPNSISRLVRLEHYLHFAVLVRRYAERYGTVYCAGSNCYFERSILVRFPFDIDQWSEDIALTLRLHVEQIAIAYDSRLRCDEAPPVGWAALVQQRRRWIFGWSALMLTASKDGTLDGMPARTRRLWSAMTLVPLILSTISASTVVVMLAWFLGALAVWAVVPYALVFIAATVALHGATRQRPLDGEGVIGFGALPYLVALPSYWALLGIVGASALLAPPRRRSVCRRALEATDVAPVR